MKRFETLEGETILAEEPIHWKNYLIPFLLLCVCTFSLLFRAYYPRESLINGIARSELIPARFQPLFSALEIAALAVLALTGIISVIRTSMTRYYVTDRRVVAVSGVIAISVQEMFIDRMETVLIHQSPYERIYGCGDVVCVAPGSQVFLDDVKDAEAFRRLLLETAMKHKKSE